MRVTMLDSRRAALDGVNVVSLIAGQEYDLPPNLAERLIARGQAAPDAPAASVPSEARADGPAPENRAQATAPQDKAPTPRRSTTRRRGGK